MRHLPRVLSFVFLLTSLNVFANSVNYTNLNVNLTIYPNFGFGDNVYGSMVGTNVNLRVFGGTASYWFDGGVPWALYAPGAVGGGDTTISFDNAAGTLGGQYYENAGIQEADFNAGTFTFPSNGKNFTVSVSATLGLVVVGCTDGGVCTTYNLTSKPGKLVLSYVYSQSQGSYYPVLGYFTNVPEPGTLGLVAIGISAFALCRRKLIRASS